MPSRIFLIFLAGLVVLGAKCWWTRFERSPPISAEEIERNGGHALRLSCGRSIEYFEFGVAASEARHTILAIHGALTTGALWGIHDQWARSHHIRIIAPSLPGWGFSPCGDLEDTPANWAQEDARELLDILAPGVMVDVLGASLGSVFAAALASNPATASRIGNVMLYVAIAPSTLDYDPLEGSQLRAFSKLHAIPDLARCFEGCLWTPLLKALLSGDAARSIARQWEGLWRSTENIYSAWQDGWQMMAQHDRKVLIVSGSDDDMAPPHNQQKLYAAIPGSELIRFQGAHVDPIIKPEIMQDHMLQLLN